MSFRIKNQIFGSEKKASEFFDRIEFRVETHTHDTHDLGTRRNAANILMKPKRLGDFAQAKYVERNENVPRSPGREGRRSR